MSKVGIVEWFGVSGSGSKCNYCKTQEEEAEHHGKKSRHGMWAHKLTAQGYQDLIDRGWRRSGAYLYKVTMNATCCPSYTIRCDTTEIKLTRSQKKVIKQVNSFLKSDIRPRLKRNETGRGEEAMVVDPQPSTEPKASEDVKISEIKKDVDVQLQSKKAKRGDTHSPQVPTVNTTSPQKPVRKSEPGPTKKAKQIRFERKIAKLMDRLNCDRDTAEKQFKTKHEKRLEQCRPKTLEEWLFPPMPENHAHQLTIKTVCTLNNEYKATHNLAHTIYQKYQTDIHKDEPSEVTTKQYKRFLVDSPLLHEEYTDGHYYGSYHMQYWLDDKLIAVGVVDILPICLSSVYFYYDPEYSFLTLGTYSALREIAYVRQLTKVRPELKYYYMGFYIHHVPKMRYKGRYQPSFLLCPETYIYQPIGRCLAKLDASKYSRLNEDKDANDNEAEMDDSDIQILCSGKWIDYETYRQFVGEHDEEEVKIYASLVGRKAAQQTLLYRDANLNK